MNFRSLFAALISIQDIDLNVDLNLGLGFRSEKYMNKGWM